MNDRSNFDTLPDSGFVTQKQLLYPAGPVPCAPSTLWAWVKVGRFPTPTKLNGANMTCWRVADVRAWLAAQGQRQAA